VRHEIHYCRHCANAHYTVSEDGMEAIIIGCTQSQPVSDDPHHCESFEREVGTDDDMDGWG
jgi:hypothetical protein